MSKTLPNFRNSTDNTSESNCKSLAAFLGERERVKKFTNYENDLR